MGTEAESKKRPAAELPDTVILFDIAMANMSFEEACTRIEARVASGEPGYVVTPNVDHVCLCHRSDEFRETYRHAFLRLPDGVPIMWTSRLAGVPLRRKLSGSDLLPRLCARAAEGGFSVFFLGGAPGTADKTAEILTRRHPSLKVAGTDCPNFGFEKDPEALRRTIDRVRSAQPGVCFVALGSPKQELWMMRHYAELEVPVCIGVGATFDFISGRVRRAPAAVQNMGLEWFWRLMQEPRRLWRRYLVHDTIFLKLVWNELRKDYRSHFPESQT